MRQRFQAIFSVPILTVALAGFAAIYAPRALAQDQQSQQYPPPQQGGENDPPSRAARLSFVSGTVSFQPGSVDDWVPATLNRPMTTGDRLWTEAGARAEMHIGSAALRLNGRGNFAFLNLDDRAAQIQLSLGTLSVRVRRLADDETFEIDTPQLALSLLRPGEYRVQVNEAGDATVVSVRGGEAEATSDGQAFPIRARDQVRVTGTDHPVYDRRDITPADSFDNWCADRDRREDMSESGRYVSRDIPGYGDLDGAGVWREEPDYGRVWMPRVEVGWAPYHFGHWAWIAPWGWTWVDDAPWGYAPFHYGRWAFIGGGWGWVPGPVVVGIRPVYAPAMVAWVGGGGFGVGIGLGVGVAAVGWFPLGPREVWVPGYATSPGYFNRVNVSNTVVNNVTINNVYVNRTNNITYANQNVNGAVSAMPQSAMTHGQPVQQAGLAVPRGAAARGQVSPVAGVAPQRDAVTGGGRNYTVAAPPPAVMNRQVVARNVPPAAPVPFAQQQQALQRNPGQPLPRASVQQMQQNSPAPRTMVRQVGPVGGSGGQGGAGGQGGGGFIGRQPPAGQGNQAVIPGGGVAGGGTIPRGQSGGSQPGGGQPGGGQPLPQGGPRTFERGQPGGQQGGQPSAGQPGGGQPLPQGGPRTFERGQPGGQQGGQSGGGQPGGGQPVPQGGPGTFQRGQQGGQQGGGGVQPESRRFPQSQPESRPVTPQPEVRTPANTAPPPRGGQDGGQSGGQRRPPVREKDGKRDGK
jgi:hypothetical protein